MKLFINSNTAYSPPPPPQGLQLLVQSPKHPAYVEGRIEAFLKKAEVNIVMEFACLCGSSLCEVMK